jgi:hypothetical protein
MEFITLNITQFATEELRLKLTCLQLDLLTLLESDPDAWQRKLKPTTSETRLVLDVHKKWKEHLNRLVAC